MQLLSKATIRYRTDGKIGNMWWKGGPIPMYQSMWYAPGKGMGTARPCIWTICYLSLPTYSRLRKMHQWQELSIQAPQLQCHLWRVSLLMQSCQGHQCQTQQATCLRVVWINLLHSDTAHVQPRNQLPWKYWNFALLADTSPPTIWDVWVGLCICLHVISYLYTIFMGTMV